MKKIKIFAGIDQTKKQLAVDKFITEQGSFDFGYIKNLKPLQTWIIAENEDDIIKSFYNYNHNLLINVDFLYKIPTEIRAQSEIKLFHKDISLIKNNNIHLYLWNLMFEKYKPRDIK